MYNLKKMEWQKVLHNVTLPHIATQCHSSVFPREPAGGCATIPRQPKQSISENTDRRPKKEKQNTNCQVEIPNGYHTKGCPCNDYLRAYDIYATSISF